MDTTKRKTTKVNTSCAEKTVQKSTRKEEATVTVTQEDNKRYKKLASEAIRDAINKRIENTNNKYQGMKIEKITEIKVLKDYSKNAETEKQLLILGMYLDKIYVEQLTEYKEDKRNREYGIYPDDTHPSMKQQPSKQQKAKQEYKARKDYEVQSTKQQERRTNRAINKALQEAINIVEDMKKGGE